MKYMIISDIHGGISELNKVLEIYEKEQCTKLLILGDLFNYLFDLNRQDILDRLNLMKENIVCVRGNCDYNISGIIFEMPYSKEINIENQKTLLTHGHLYNMEYLLGTDYSIIISGHTHVPLIKKIHDKLFLNPGSISKSRKGENSFIIINNNLISIRSLNNEIIQEEKIQ